MRARVMLGVAEADVTIVTGRQVRAAAPAARITVLIT